ncbi:Vacuolar protein-sorting-associated protein 24 [Coemansia sp. RSA 989]|nr:vacuolar protein-like protein sorting 24 [Coemansia mojavensis]KAJ1743933.1 Vacuolar protein-sorting-associated protein 24 [Coemansia sp. RSA 1086]KAJ1867691.1 Vacuolar protein-sorting-associated protein 24 [Coemansia sp. RSA 989]KAJ2628856.1 Vacuolar protein-sorting-associated protein 24 [Coemansia sp. RSA 1290]KAJ2650683.1 Vacuolar protein-sorting-associated protein 24 [Coemansia sp. RSA 1250]KAJ2673854.1 Vacuolar protein-sorting-associated protein 24 [Coemansia sp. RSA 1085]
MFSLFAKKPTPEELVRKWRSGIRTQQRALDRQIQTMSMEEKKAERTIKGLAKKGDISSCKILAKELVRSRKQRDRLATNKAQLNSISMELGYQLSKLKVVGSLQKSTQVMQSVNRLMSVPMLQRTLMEMSREMMKAGVIDEMTEDMMDSLEDREGDEEEEVEEEMNKVLAQVTDGLLGEIGSVPGDTKLPAMADSEAESEPDLEEMQKRLSALRS